jgi:hypothetical protein
MDEEWDHLIVLDGCRYDYFSRLHCVHMEGKLERALSVGSNTEEWRDNSFPDRYGDVVYVSTRAVNRAAREALMQYPCERLIIHYLQPHCPYIDLQPQDTGFPVQAPGVRTVLDGTKLPRGTTVREKVVDIITALTRSSPLRNLDARARLRFLDSS